MSAKLKARKFVRKNITVPADFDEKMTRLQDELGLGSSSELIRYAINRLAESGHPAFNSNLNGDLAEAGERKSA